MKSASLLVAAFLTLVLGVAGFLVVIAEEEQALVTLKSVSNESVDISSAKTNNAGNDVNINVTITFTTHEYGTGWRTTDTDCEIANFVWRNQTGDDMTSATHYVLNATFGTATLMNVTQWNVSGPGNNVTSVSYSYCGEDYLSEGWNRNVMDVVVGFFALALLIISVALFYQIAKQEGLFGYGI